MSDRTSGKLFTLAVVLLAALCSPVHAQDLPDLRGVLLGGTTSITYDTREAAWRYLAQQPVTAVAGVVHEILRNPEAVEFYTPVGMLLHDIVQRLGEAHFVEVIQDALLHSRSPKLLKDLGAVGIGDEAWSWAVYEALATRADDPEMRRIAGASLRALTYSGRGYLNFEPKTAFGHYCRGCAYYRGGARSGLSIEQSLRAAMSELDQAIEADQEHHEASVAKAEVLKRMGRAQEALAILDETIRQTPDDADAIATRASVWRKIGNRERAEADAATATAIRERERQTFLQTQEGLLQTMAEVDQDATTTILLAADNKDAGQYRAMALDDYDDILKHHAAECSVYYLRRALFHWYFGDGEAALRDTTAFLDKQPRASYGHYLLARILAARNDAQGSAAAQREYQALVAINALPVVAPPATPTQLPLTDLNFYTATDLAEKGEPGSIIKIAQALAASNGDCMTRMVAADALGESFDPQDVAPVISYIEMTYGRVVDDPKFEPKAHIFKLVAKLKLASGPGFLAAAATADSGAISTDAAGQAIEALANYPVQTAVAYLEYAVGHAHRRETRVAAVGALARLQKMSAEEVETRLIVEGTRGQQVGAASAWGLREFGLLVLYEIATDPADQSTRQLALDALRQCGHTVAQRAAQ